MIADFEEAICDAVRAALAEELVTVSPAVTVSIFAEDDDHGANRVEINASVTGSEHIPGAAYTYQAIRRAQVSMVFVTPKIPAVRSYVSAVKCRMRHVVERSWETNSTVAGLLAQSGIQIHPAPSQLTHSQEEMTEAGTPFIVVRMDYGFTFNYES